MYSNKFIGETLVHKLWLLDKFVLVVATAMYQEATSTLMSLLQFVFECILAENLQAFTMCRWLLHVGDLWL